MRCVAILLLTFLSLQGIPAGSVSGAEPERRPNVILVMADDLGWSDIGCFGGEIRTPHIDSLARDGLSFTQFYNNAICGPTRASLLTGLYCQQAGHRGDRWNEPKDYSKCVLVSEVLKKAGYHTMMVGKWQGRDLAVDRGFHRFFGPMCQAKISYFHEVAQNPYYLDRDRWELPDDFYLTEAINKSAVDFLNEAVQGKKPYFLYVAHIAPHWPLHARESDVAAYREQYLEQGWDELRALRFAAQKKAGLVPSNWTLSPHPAGVKSWKETPHHAWEAERMAVYAAQVESIDRGLGQLLKIVEKAGQVDNTLVLFLSDNGAAPDGGLSPSDAGFGFGPKQKNNLWRKDNVPIRPGSGPENMPGPHNTFAAYGLAWANLSNTPFRDTKLTGYEGGIRTPLIARWPRVIGKSQQTGQVGHVMDLMATCLDVADAEYPKEFEGRKPIAMEGISLLSVFKGEEREGHAMLAWSLPRHHAIRMGNWKAIRPKNGGKWQLFNLHEDGTETSDLAADAPERVADLARRFEEWRVRVKATE